MDEIHIKQLEVFAHHGVFPEENRLGQKFIVSADLRTDLRKAGLADDLQLSMDYGAVCGEIQEFLTRHTFQLLETAAEQLCTHLLQTLPLLRSIRLEIEKPWAPIGLPLKTASVSIERGWHTAYIALGSNMGDREAYLAGAVNALRDTEGIRVETVSDFLMTAPYGVTDQDPFLNGCMKLQTLLTPHELLDCFHGIEQKAGRVRARRWGPRTLDLDILFYDDLVLEDEVLTIPHRDMQNRDFVLRPMKQIAPWVRHPVLNKTIEEMEKELP